MGSSQASVRYLIACFLGNSGKPPMYKNILRDFRLAECWIMKVTVCT